MYQENGLFLSAKQLSELIEMSPKFIRNMANQNRIAGAIKVGGRWKFNKNEVIKRLNFNSEFLLPA